MTRPIKKRLAPLRSGDIRYISLLHPPEEEQDSGMQWASCQESVREPQFTVSNAGTSFAQVVVFKPTFQNKSATYINFKKPCSDKVKDPEQ